MNLGIEIYFHFPLQGGNLWKQSSEYNNNPWHNNMLPSCQYKSIFTTCGPTFNERLLNNLGLINKKEPFDY